MRAKSWASHRRSGTAAASGASASAVAVALAACCAVLAGCTGSTAPRPGPPSSAAAVTSSASSAGTAVSQASGAGWVPPGSVPAAPRDRVASQYAACQQSAEGKRKASAKNLPRATGHDVQCLADSLTVADVSHAGTIAEYRTVTDPTAASRTLSGGILSGVQADLDAFDKAAYAKGSGATPDFVVAIATPKAGLPNIGFLGKVMTGFQLTDLFTPPTLGANGQAHRLTIACGTSSAQKQTLCAWEGIGETTAGEQPFDGALLFSSPMTSGLAESNAEAVIASLAPVV
jgi:hypothetical protein